MINWAGTNDWRIPEHFDDDWRPELYYNIDIPDDPFKPYGATPGHGIEWARLILQWTAASFDDPGSEEAAVFVEAARALYHQAVDDAWDADGAPGLVYTTDWDGRPVVHDRMHWTLAEALNTSAALYKITGIDGYMSDHAMFMEYLDRYVIDHEKGSWLHQLDRSNKVKDTVWPGKPDLYHAVQATLIPYLSPDTSIAKAVRISQYF